jgi:hypothetical protein
MKNRFAVLAVCALTATVAVADTVDAQYIQVAGGNDATRLKVGTGTYRAGHMVHEYTSGPRSGDRFSTFCIDFDENANSSEGATYDIIDIADAPMPGTPYGQEIADKINAVVANAAALGWIDNRLQADTNQEGYLAKMGAIQAAIWEAFGSPIKIENRRTNNDLADYYYELTNPQTFDESLRMAGLRAMVAPDQQDMLYVVPLPPAVFAGAGLLMGIGGIRSVRRRRNA